MEGKDRISELPVGILDNILGFLPIQEAARTAILSSYWKDIWFSLTKLDFGFSYFDYIYCKRSDGEDWESESPCFDIINKILMRHNGPIHKIRFDFIGETFDFEDIGNLVSGNLNKWFLLLTQNSVEEIDISYWIDGNAKCKVPICIFSCPTLKRLRLRKVSVELINAYCVLPNVTSLCLNDIDFKPRNCSNYVVYLPMLQYLSFDYCDDICYFNIVAPKLGSLKIILYDCSPYYHKKFGVLPPNLDLRSISSFDLSCSPCCFEMFIEELTRVGHALALNVELLRLDISKDDYVFSSPDINNSAFIQLLRACPKLCKLDICHPECFNLNPEDFVLMEELSSVARTLKMLRTLKFSPFFGSRSQMQSIKALLACFPEIKKVVIVRDWIDRFRPDEKFKIKQELLDFSRASTKPEIFYV